MNYQVKINGIDVSSQVIAQTLKQKSNLNQNTDTASIVIKKYGSIAYTPAANDEIEVYNDSGIKVFAGVLNGNKKTLEDHTVLVYDLEFSGYVFLLEGRVINEKYESTTGDAIIADLQSKYATTFTINNVNAAFPVESIIFSRMTLKEAIDKLAKLSNYSWYVDDDRDIHFFPKYTESAPFNLSDDSANFVFESLEISDDYTQIRNRVFIRGGEIEGNARTESKIADGTQLTFPLTNKFSKLPAVTVAAAAKTVGVDFLDAEDDFDCFWNYDQKYIRFKDATKPSNGQAVAVTGIPLYRLTLQVQDDVSIEAMGGEPDGVLEYVVSDDTIKSADDALTRAQTELESYATKIIEGSFETNNPGLRAGQIIHITSTKLEVDEDFIIQSVSFSALSPDFGSYKASVATLRTIGIIDVLIDQIRRGQKPIDDRADETLQRWFFPKENVEIEEVVVRNVLTPRFVYGPYVPSSLSEDNKVKARYGNGKYN